MNDKLGWQDLEVLKAVMEEGNFSLAATALNVSQPTVSRQVEQLERKLGKELFTRSRSGLQPTGLAHQLATDTSQMSESAYSIRRALDGIEETPSGVVTIHLPYGFGAHPLVLALKGFHEKYHDIVIEFKNGSLASNLGRREVDIDLRWIKPTEPEVVAREFGTFHLAFYASQCFIERYGMPQTSAELSALPWPLFGEAIMDAFRPELEHLGIEPTYYPFHCAGNAYLNPAFSAIGTTIAILPVGLQPPDFQRLLPDIAIPPPEMWLSMHSSLRRNARIRAVWDWLVEHLPAAYASTRETPSASC